MGQGRRSKVKVKCSKSCFDITVTYLSPCLEVKVKGRGQGQRSRSKVGVKVKGQGRMYGAYRSILGARLVECSKGQLTSNLEQRVVITGPRVLSVCL